MTTPTKHVFPFDWKLSDGYPAKWIKARNLNVYTTFACGWGSTMGYKLAGFNMIGANDIDPQMAKLYQANHHPKRFDLCPISELLTKELPAEMFDLDILDWSPPCSTFSMAGEREAGFGKLKKFREWQAEQVLSDLFFEFIKLADRLRPKVVIAENVKWMLIWNAKAYTHKVLEDFKAIGYDVQLFLLNSAFMGICQKRERVFFIARRRDLNFPEVKMNFNEEIIPFRDIDEGNVTRRTIYPCDLPLWEKIRPGQNCGKAHPKGHRFNSSKMAYNLPINTIAASDGSCFYHPEFPWFITDKEMILAGSFPTDYNFCGMKPQYTIGMSVPPVMMAQVANQVAIQIFNS